MVSHPDPVMPTTTSLSLEHILPPKLDTSTSHIFQPPQTPSASTILHRSTASLDSQDGTHTSRKRLRHDSRDCELPWSRDYGWSSAQDTPRAMSPAPFVSTQYRLAGGVDTPTASAVESVISPDMTMRGGRGWRPGGGSPDSYFPQLAREGNGRARRRATSRRDGWGQTIYSVFGVAGRVWEFCRMSAFRGFYAGGGRGYQMCEPGHALEGDGRVWESYDEKDLVRSMDEGQALVPGGFPDEDFIADYMSHDHTTPSRPAKRIQREKGEPDLGASWVMIGKNSARASRESSPSRISARKVPIRSSPGRRPASKIGQRPILPASRPSFTSFPGSPALCPGRPASFANSRSPMSSPKHESPVSADVQRHMARMRKRELEEDANLKRLNQQLKAMIKEGKEALGTKFEVEEISDEVVDEGYVEGEYPER